MAEADKANLAPTNDNSYATSDDSSNDSSDDESIDLPRGKNATVSDGNLSAWPQLFKENGDMSKGLKLEQYDVDEVVQLSQEDVHDSKRFWEGCLIGYVVGKRTEYRDIEELLQAWKISFNYESHSSGWTVFKFKDEEEKQTILTNGPYFSSGFLWIMKDIPPFFSFDDESFSFIPVWITLPGLPIECWCTKALGKITSRVGKPIATDKCTALQARISFARVLVEIDAREPLTRKVPIKLPNGDLYYQSVFYEFEPKLCSTCNRVGHMIENCKSNMEPRGNENPGVDFLRQKSNKTYVEVVHATEAHTAQPKHANAAEGTSKGPAEARTTQPHSAEACTAQTRPRNALARTAQAKRANAAEETSKTNADAMQTGRGTALNDIPNVAYKLSRKKSNETFKLLHTILFARRGKVTQIKSNISRFSGFVWHENEEKQKIKVKEKLDKCVKEKLMEICDVLDIPIVEATTRKEDIVVKLIEFLEAPHATTTELLAEKELSSKGKKLKRVSKGSGSASGSTPSKSSAKSRKKADGASVKSEEEKGLAESEDESEEVEEEEEEEHEEADEKENANGLPEKSEDEMSDQAESEKESDSEANSEDENRSKKRVSKKPPKKESAGGSKMKKDAVPKKSPPPSKSTPSKSASSRSKVTQNTASSPKVPSRKKKTETEAKEKPSTLRKSALKESIGKKVEKGRDKPKDDKLKPSDDELRAAICEILKEVDFNTATFNDILKQLAKRFNADLTPRKSSIKLMIEEELTKLADEADDEEDEGDGEKDNRRPSGQDVEA